MDNKKTKWSYALAGFILGIVSCYTFAISVNHSVLEDIGVIKERKEYIDFDDANIPEDNESTGLDLNPGSH